MQSWTVGRKFVQVFNHLELTFSSAKTLGIRHRSAHNRNLGVFMGIGGGKFAFSIFP